MKTWEGKRNLKFTRISGKTWFDVYHELEEKEIINNCDIYGYAEQRNIKLVDLTEDDIKTLIYDETIHEYDCEMLEYKYSIENKHHDETERFETLEEAKEKLAEYEEDDREEGTYEEDYYRIIDLATGKEVE